MKEEGGEQLYAVALPWSLCSSTHTPGLSHTYAAAASSVQLLASQVHKTDSPPTHTMMPRYTFTASIYSSFFCLPSLSIPSPATIYVHVCLIHIHEVTSHIRNTSDVESE